MEHAVITVSGLVTGVGFRYRIRHIARHHKLAGKVENLEDETVRITCEGQEDAIKRLVEDIRNMEKPIEIDDIQVEYGQPTGKYKGFKIVLGDTCAEIVEGHATGAMYLHDIRGKQDQMLEKQDQMLEKQDQMLEKQDNVISEIRVLSSDVRAMIDTRFQQLEDEITKIKTKLSI